MNTIVIKCNKLVKYPSCGRASAEKLVNLGLAEMGLKVKKENFDENMENLKVTLDIDECLKFLGYANKRKKQSLKQLIEIIEPNKTITLIDNEYAIDKAHFISGFSIDMKSRKIILRYNPELIDLLFLAEEYTDEKGELKKRIKKEISNPNKTIQYVSYDLKMFQNTNRGFIIRMYEILKMFSYKEKYYVKIEDLKAMLDMKDNKSYSEFAVFNDKILKPAIKYICENTDIKVRIDTKKCKKVSFKVSYRNKDGDILLDRNGQPKTKTQYKIETIAFLINVKEVSEEQNLELIAMGLHQIVNSSVKDVKSFMTMLKNKLNIKNNPVTYKQIETLIKKAGGNKDLVLGAINASYLSKTRTHDMMAYAYGILEKAEKDVNIKKDLLNSIEKMRKHYIKKQSNTIKTATDNKVSI